MEKDSTDEPVYDLGNYINIQEVLGETDNAAIAEKWAILYLRMLVTFEPACEREAKAVYNYVLENIRFFYRLK
jgi:hypothetical protein